jgi:hypothetical protein
MSLPRAAAVPRGEPAAAPLGETCFGPQQSGMVKGAEVVRTRGKTLAQAMASASCLW